MKLETNSGVFDLTSREDITKLKKVIGSGHISFIRPICFAMLKLLMRNGSE